MRRAPRVTPVTENRVSLLNSFRAVAVVGRDIVEQSRTAPLHRVLQLASLQAGRRLAGDDIRALVR